MLIAVHRMYNKTDHNGQCIETWNVIKSEDFDKTEAELVKQMEIQNIINHYCMHKLKCKSEE